MGEITFNGITSTSVGIQVAHPPMYVYPEKDSEAVHVPGRNGDIIIDKDSYKNVPREYEITVYDQAHPEWTYSQRVVKLSNWLHSARGYAKLSDTYDAGYFRKARYVEEAQEIENFINQGGAGTITFDCRPERYYASYTVYHGDPSVSETYDSDTAAAMTENFTLFNPTRNNGAIYYAKPYLKISNPLNLTFTLKCREDQSGSGYPDTLLSVTGATVSSGECWIIVDSDLQVVSSNSETPFTYTLPNGFPIFKEYCRIQIPTGVSTIEVIPRWYII